ncbi:MAG: hypothetical protein U0Q16_31130 [Bryobacteraceae bacterium]
MPDPNVPSRLQLIAWAGLSLAVYVAIGLTFTFGRPPSGDEGHFADTIRAFATSPSWELLRTYEEMSGPLPFAVYAAWGKVFGTGLFSLRIANLVAGALLQVSLFALLMETLGSSRRTWLAAVYFLLQPYLVYLSLFVHTDVLAMLGVALGYRTLLRGKRFTAALALGAALLARQYCIFIPAGLAAAALADRNRENVRNLLAGFVACLPLAALCIFWGGPNPANQIRHRYASEAFRFHPESLVLYLAMIPVYAAPFLRFGFAARDAIVAAFFAAMYWLAPVAPSPSSHAATVDTVGAFHWIVRWLGATSAIEQAIFCTAFAVAGALVSRVIRLWGANPRAQWFHWQTAAFLAIMPLSYLHWEKYLLPALPAIVIAMLLERGGADRQA